MSGVAEVLVQLGGGFEKEMELAGLELASTP
jgi:hypothetical protein